MPIGINSFLATAGLQRHLDKTQAALQTAVGRLSSGARINAARDDAAGLAIADRMQTQIRSREQAARNTNDGISALQVAEGSLAQITENLQRIRELAVQAANGTNTRSDRLALQAEVNQLMMANLQIGRETEFNGQRLLDGSFENADLQVGAGSGDIMHVRIGAAIATATSGAVLQPVQFYQAVQTGAAVTTALSAGDLTVNNVSIGATAAGDLTRGRTANSAWAVATAIGAANISSLATVTGRTLANGNTVSVGGAGRTLADGDLTINGVTLGAIFGANASDFANNVKAAVDASGTGVTANISVSGSQATISLVSADGGDILVGGNSSIVAAANYKGSVTITTALDEPGRAKLVIGGNNPLRAGFTAGTYAADPSGAPVPTLVTVSGGGEPDVQVMTIEDATEAIRYADRKLDRILGIRAEVGAVQNKLGSVLQGLAIGTENLATARARIADADYAAETMELTRTQILQEAGMAVMSQANLSATLVLDLLKF